MAPETISSPTVRRRRLGVELKRHREAVDMAVEAVAARMGRHVRSIRRWEAGQVGIAPADLADLCDLYAVPPAEREHLLTLSREGSMSGWWVRYRDVIRPSYARFLGLGGEATGLMEYSLALLPGLLQTDDYAREIISRNLPSDEPAVIEKRLEIRQARKAEAAERQYPITYVIDESVLHRVVGNRRIMAEQMQHLLTMAESERISLHVHPFAEDGLHRSIASGFAVLTFADIDPIAVVEMLSGDVYADGPEATQYTLQFEALRQGALSEVITADVINDMKWRYQ